MTKKPHVLVLGGNFAGSGAAQKKLVYEEMFFHSHGKVPNWDVSLSSWVSEHINI